MATLMLSQGTPMVLAGDELGNSQSGNNNAYCQDNEIGWVDWDNADKDFLEFCRKAIAFRKATPILRQGRFLHAQARFVDGKPDLFWRRADGQEMTDEDWNRPDQRLLGAEMRMARGTPDYEPRLGALYAVFNAGNSTRVKLPDCEDGQYWERAFDTDDAPHRPRAGKTAPIAANSVVAFTLKSNASPDD